MSLPKKIRIKWNSLENSLSYSYKKVIISDPFKQSFQIVEVAKGAKGVYIFEVAESNNIYVVLSINLYNRVCSYLCLLFYLSLIGESLDILISMVLKCNTNSFNIRTI